MSRTKSDRQPPTVRQLTNRPVDLEIASPETIVIDGVLQALNEPGDEYLGFACATASGTGPAR
jgi:hypothetical protein